MAERSSIEWTDATWNPVRGCTRLSEGCRHCYAEAVAARFSGPGLPYEGLATRVGGQARWTGKLSFGHHLEAPLRWRRPRRIFVNSMSDLFHEAMLDAWIDHVFAVMALCPQHTFQVLTKRPERMRAYVSEPAVVQRVYSLACDIVVEGTASGVILIAPGVDEAMAPAGTRVHLDRWPLPNVWLGTSCEDQATADARVPELLATPAAVRFVSAEPLLGPIDFRSLRFKSGDDLPEAMRVNCEHGSINALRGISTWPASHYQSPVIKKQSRILNGEFFQSDGEYRILDWIIVGGESGRRARPMHPAWERAIRDQCAGAGVAFFKKQSGEFRPVGPIFDADSPPVFDVDERRGVIICKDGSIWPDAAGQPPAGAWMMERVGKKAAGRLLDGVEWNQMPEVR